MFIFEGNEIETDSEGYLKDTTLWSEALATAIAEREGIVLSTEHWGGRAFCPRLLSGVQHLAGHSDAGEGDGK
ncbi:Sulfurtransferase TusE [Raoultella terrigena]|uniref:Sulfurtransferase TusE n=1 Tax=Raoultella terrigena TaxID=577 RepID=A0A4U9DCS5_RAOTE|nr:Sulfurtransferase TusE [Raoultella terrigena]